MDILVLQRVWSGECFVGASFELPAYKLNLSYIRCGQHIRGMTSLHLPTYIVVIAEITEEECALSTMQADNSYLLFIVATRMNKVCVHSAFYSIAVYITPVCTCVPA
jgi:hypothetical protein